MCAELEHLKIETRLTSETLVSEMGEYASVIVVVYYESLKRELKTKTIYEYRCDERLIKLT